MLLSLTLERPPADDLGFLLHKHPDRLHRFSLSYGNALVYFPERTQDRCTAVLQLDLNAVDLVRGAKTLEQYVTDRPYTANSFLSVAINHVYRSAMNGSCKEKPDLPMTPLPFEARLPTLPCSPELLERLLKPLGYQLEASPLPSHWKNSAVWDVRIRASCCLKDLLNHLYVLIPVFDDEKHYFVGEEEIEKLLSAGSGWLASHPEAPLIARRYLKHKNSLTRQALSALAGEAPLEDSKEEQLEERFEEGEERGLNRLRYRAAVEALEGCSSIVDLGCGEGKLLQEFLKKKSFKKVCGVDISLFSLQQASRRIKPDRLLEPERLLLLHGSLSYRDDRLCGFEGAALIEVIEHLPENRLPALEDAIFGYARPLKILVSTPNSEYNVLFPNMTGFRHSDHRFEWSRARFQDWCNQLCSRYGYRASYQSIGPEHPLYGPPTQAALFVREPT